MTLFYVMRLYDYMVKTGIQRRKKKVAINDTIIVL